MQSTDKPIYNARIEVMIATLSILTDELHATKGTEKEPEAKQALKEHITNMNDALKCETKRLNLNSDVKVRLTEKGYKRMADRYNEFVEANRLKLERREPSYYKEQADSDGFCTMQMWKLMDEFGGMHMAIDQLMSLDLIIV